jgi:2-polyprenyl-6-methoxyphenol hydroxylase-like FAD-dependent oxidoreductase
VQRGNLRVPRVVLRKLLSERLAPGTIQWGWKLRRYEEDADRRGVTAHFERATPSVEGGGGPATVVEHTARGDVLIGADGVRSVVRSLKFGDAHRYVGIVVVLGVSDHQDPLTREQGFYTVDGTHRMFTMPYEPIEEEEEEEADARADARTHGADAAGRHTTMWQLSFAEADEARARALTDRGGEALLAEVRQRCAKWHSPVPAMLAATAASSVWGTLLVDRAAMPLRKKNRDDTSAPWRSRVTLVGDAAHCMTPFKGQGANQALADAPLLAKYLGPALCEPEHVSRLKVPSALSKFEREMGDRAEAKVVASREAAGNYHSKAALEPGSYGIEGIPIERMADFLTTLRERGVGAESGAELEQRAIEIAAEMCDLPS